MRSTLRSEVGDAGPCLGICAIYGAAVSSRDLMAGPIDRARTPAMARIASGAAATLLRLVDGAKAGTDDKTFRSCRTAQRPRRHRAVPPQSPFAAKPGIVADNLDDDEVRLRPPWDPTKATIGDMVHGGAIANHADVTGVGRVLRRGRSLVNCEAEVVDPAGRLAAKAPATYKVG